MRSTRKLLMLAWNKKVSGVLFVSDDKILGA